MSAGHRYEVLELETVDFGTMDLKTVSADMVVESENGATIVVTDPFNVLGGVMDLRQWWQEYGPDKSVRILPKRIQLREILYAIWAPDAEAGKLRIQQYRHKFEGDCWLDGAWQLRTQPGPMFAEYELNFLIDAKSFRKQPAIQFIN